MGELHNTYIDSACNYIVHALNALGTLMDRRHTTLTRTLIVIAAIIALSGAASADDYYVATWGDNNAQGNIAHPWQNVSYATQQAVAGDTIHLFDGTWYDEHAIFANSGNATHPITLTAYNGTPTLDGVDKTGFGIYLDFKDYIEISHLTIRRYYHTIYTPGSYIHISDCDLSDTGGVVIVISQYNSKHNTIENCTLYDSGWNTIQMSGNREPPKGNGIPATYITVRNCTIYNSTVHNAIDLFGNLQYVTIEGNELYSNPAGCIYEHDVPDHREYVTIRDNYFHNTQSTAIQVGANSYYEIYNNTFENILNSYPIYIYENAHDYNIYDNSFYNCKYSPRIVGGYNLVFDRNYIHTDSGVYISSYGATTTIRNPLGKQQVVAKYGYATADMEFDDGTLFTATFGGASEYTPVRYYPDKSSCSITTTKYGQYTLTPTTYNVTLRPTYGHLYDVTVDTWDEASGTYRITASSTESKNPTWVNLATKAASATYDITIDGKSSDQATTGADGVLRYYIGTWDGPQTFEFSYASGGVDPTPDPAPCVANLRNDTPTQNTVTLRWDCSAPNMDYYTIHQTGAIPVDTVNKYYSAPKLEPDTPYTFGVSATNTAGITGDIVSITVRTASDGADPVPCVENLRNDTPTQNSVTLRWDCSAPDMDYYTIYQTGAIPVDTVNKYYSAPNLASDTPYTFGVSATNTAGITGDIVSITVRTAAEDNSLTARAGSDQTVNVNTLVTLDGSTSTADCGIKSYVWDFDSRNGIQIDATGAIVSHTCTEPRAYITTLTVTDTSGQTDSDTVLITVIEETTQTTDVSKITESIVPDGSLSEWAGADTVIFAGSDNTATVSLTWDGDNLYLGFDVTDTNLQASGTDEADSLHLDDSIEIYLDTNHNGGAAMQVDDYHFIINLNGALVDDQGTGSGKNYSWTGHANYAIDLDGTLNDDSDTDNGYVVEVAIPWSDLGGSPVTGDVMGLDLGVNDRDDPADGRKPFDWCNIDSSWAVPDGWGDMTFVENFDSNTLYIADDVTASQGSYVTVPIMIYDATEIACYGVNLTYNASVVAVTSVTQGDFTTYFGFDDESTADGWVTINTYVSETSLTGDVKIADVTLKAVGDAGDTSPLDLEIIAMTDRNGYPVSGTVSNGLFTVVSDTSPPVVTHPSASQLISDDTDGVPSWGETATLNVTVTDESDIASVTIDLSAIGGSPVQPMTHIGNNVWSVTTSASAGTPPQTYDLTVCATDVHGYINMHESVELVVMRNGDVTGDGDVRPDDVALLENYVTYPGRYTISSEFVADVTDDGVVNIADAMVLANYVASPDQPLRYVGS